MTNPYNFLTDCDPVEMDLRLNASLGKPFDFSSGNFDPIEIDRRIVATPPIPPGPIPIDYTYGSINYKDEFASVPKNTLVIRDGKVLISFDAQFETHGLFSFRMYFPEDFLKILVEYSIEEYTSNSSVTYYLQDGKPLECMSMFLWDTNRDFSSEPIVMGRDSNPIIYDPLPNLINYTTPINIPPSLIHTMPSYVYEGRGSDSVVFHKVMWHTVRSQLQSSDPGDLLNPYAVFFGYNFSNTGKFGCIRVDDGYGFSPSRNYPPQKQIVLTPGLGLQYIFSGINNPFGYYDGVGFDIFTGAQPFKNSWKYDGTDGELGRAAAGQPFPQDVADHIPTEWNTL